MIIVDENLAKRQALKSALMISSVILVGIVLFVGIMLNV